MVLVCHNLPGLLCPKSLQAPYQLDARDYFTYTPLTKLDGGIAESYSLRQEGSCGQARIRFSSAARRLGSRELGVGQQ